MSGSIRSGEKSSAQCCDCSCSSANTPVNKIFHSTATEATQATLISQQTRKLHALKDVQAYMKKSGLSLPRKWMASQKHLRVTGAATCQPKTLNSS